MAISGAHVIVYSRACEADRAFFRDVLDYPHVDAAGGWLIFRLPPAEVAVHPGEDTSSQEPYLMCDDLDATMSELSARGVRCTDITEARWGRLSRFPPTRVARRPKGIDNRTLRSVAGASAADGPTVSLPNVPRTGRSRL